MKSWPLSTTVPDAQSPYAYQAEAPTQSFVQRECVTHTQSHVPSTFIEAMPRRDTTRTMATCSLLEEFPRQHP
jgi:hypothetical protein